MFVLSVCAYRRWVSETFDHVLCDDLLPYPNATLRNGTVPYRVHFYWCSRRILSAVVVGRFGRNFSLLVAQVRNEQNQPIGTLRTARSDKKLKRFSIHDCHGAKTTACMNRSSVVRHFTLFWNTPLSNTKWSATENTTFMITVGKPLNLWRLAYRIPEFTGDPQTNHPPLSMEPVTFPEKTG